MEGITPLAETVDQILILLSIAVGLLYFSNYIYCHVALGLGVILLTISLVISQLKSIPCDILSSNSLYDLYTCLKYRIRVRSLIWHYISFGLIFSALVGYFKVTAYLLYEKLKKIHISNSS